MLYKDQIIAGVNESTIATNAESIASDTGSIDLTVKSIEDEVTEISSDVANLVGKGSFSYVDVVSTITRPTNTTAYDINDIVNSNAATTLLEVNFNGAAGQKVNIRNIKITSNNPISTAQLSPTIILFNTPTLTGITLTDNAALDDVTSAHYDIVQSRINNTDLPVPLTWFGTIGYEMELKGLDEYVTLDANGKAYLLVLAKAAYTPISGEIIKVHFAGYLL